MTVVVNLTNVSPPGGQSANPKNESTAAIRSPMEALKDKYYNDLRFMRSEFQKLEAQLNKGANNSLNNTTASRDRKEKLKSFIAHLEDVMRQLKDHEVNTSDNHHKEEAAAKNLEQHIVTSLLPVKDRLKKQLQAAPKNSVANPSTKPIKGTFAQAAISKHKSTSTHFGKPLGGGSSLTQKLHGSTLGSADRTYGSGVGVKNASETPCRKILYAGMAVGASSSKDETDDDGDNSIMDLENDSNSVKDPPVPPPPPLPRVAPQPKPMTTIKPPQPINPPKTTSTKTHSKPIIVTSKTNVPAVKTLINKIPSIIVKKVQPMSAIASMKPPTTISAPQARIITGDSSASNNKKLVPQHVVSNSNKPKIQPDPVSSDGSISNTNKNVKLNPAMDESTVVFLPSSSSSSSTNQQKRKKRRIKEASAASSYAVSSCNSNRINVSSSFCTSTKTSAEYICALCNETYPTECSVNPWWVLSHEQCPKCNKMQIPRIDISAAANAIDYHPALLAHADEGLDDVAVHDVQSSLNFAHNDNDDDDFDSDSEESVPGENFGHVYAGPKLDTVNSAKLLILMAHASRCPGNHKYDRHKQVCLSVKYLMLHVRDCSGTLSSGELCPYPWCRKVKHLLFHLMSCPTPDKCTICRPTYLSKKFMQLQRLNAQKYDGGDSKKGVGDKSGSMGKKSAIVVSKGEKKTSPSSSLPSERTSIPAITDKKPCFASTRVVSDSSSSTRETVNSSGLKPDEPSIVSKLKEAKIKIEDVGVQSNEATKPVSAATTVK